ncbi:MAG: shikimate dehydrogenase, partial [Dehalococcoidia bacterium]
GYPIKHSISPQFQQAALDYHQLDIRYELWETEPARLRRVVDDLRKPQNVGANVTVPYKEAVLPMLDRVDDLVAAVGAVNTIVKEGDELVGHNTDVYGFLEALNRVKCFDPAGKRVVVLGAGGAARSVGAALVQKKAASLAITDGVFERAGTLAEHLARYAETTLDGVGGSGTGVAAFPWQRVASEETFAGCNLIVHCTTIGMKHSEQEGRSPLSQEVIPGGALVYDLVYNPRTTPLLELAQQAGADTLGGLPMLVYQGAASFRLWTGMEAPVEVMLRKAGEML